MSAKKLVRKKKKTNKKLQKRDLAVKKYFSKKYLIIGLVILLALFSLRKSLVGIGVLAISIPLAKFSVRITRFVNYITFETYTASTITISFLYGPVAGALSGLFLGFWGYLSNSVTKFLALLNVFVAAIMGFGMGYFNSTFDYNMFFIISIVFNNIFAYFIFVVFDPDQVQNVTYRATHLIWNIFVVRLFYLVLYDYLIIHFI